MNVEVVAFFVTVLFARLGLGFVADLLAEFPYVRLCTVERYANDSDTEESLRFNTATCNDGVLSWPGREIFWSRCDPDCSSSTLCCCAGKQGEEASDECA